MPHFKGMTHNQSSNAFYFFCRRRRGHSPARGRLRGPRVDGAHSGSGRGRAGRAGRRAEHGPDAGVALRTEPGRQVPAAGGRRHDSQGT